MSAAPYPRLVGGVMRERVSIPFKRRKKHRVRNWQPASTEQIAQLRLMLQRERELRIHQVVQLKQALQKERKQRIQQVAQLKRERVEQDRKLRKRLKKAGY